MYVIGSIFALPNKLLTMGYVDVKTAKKALESYIKGLVQDFMNETGMPVADIEVCSTIDASTNTRTITEVRVLADEEMITSALL